MVPLVVDPQALFASGGAVVAAGDGLNANLIVLATGVAANTGHDVAGEVFGLGYQDAAEALLKAAAAAIDACRHSGALIQQGASNYSKAEAASTLGGGAGVLQAPVEPVKVSVPGPPGTLGPGKPPPLLWAVVESLVDDVWPDGDVAGLHAAAARWRGFGAAASGMRGALETSKSLWDGQQIPEGGKIDDALSQIGDFVGKLGEQCGRLAWTLDNFANEVDAAQNHIRDLLDRLGSLADLGHDVMLIVKGDAIDEIKKIAKDINDVLHDLGREARAFEQGIKLLMQIGDGLVVDLEKYMRGKLTHYLGDEVGNPVATVFDTWVNTNEGVLKGAVGMVQGMVDLDPRWFLLDPKGAATTWSGMTKAGVINAFINPQEAGEEYLQQFKSMLHLDDWSTTRPGLGFGENLFDVGMLFVPGAGEAGGAAEAGRAAARGAEAAAGTAERAGGFADIAGAPGALVDMAKASGGVTKDLEGLTGNLPTVDAPLDGRPVGLPALKPFDAPVGPAEGPTTPEAMAPQLPRAAGGPHDPVLAPAAGSPPAPLPFAAGEPVTSAIPQLAEHSPDPVPTSAAPRFVPAVGRPPEIPGTGGGSLSGPPHGNSPHGGGPQIGHQHELPAHDGAHHLSPIDALTSDDLSALSDYTGFGYQDLNDALRSGALDASQHARVEALNNALDKLPAYEGSVVRGTNLPPEVLAQYRPGEYFIEKGFMSSTVNTAVARSPMFAGNVEFRILSSTGRDISSISMFPAEQEILFPAGTRFYVVSKTVDPITGTTVIRMAER